jgi:hypothetical protein
MFESLLAFDMGLSRTEGEAWRNFGCRMAARSAPDLLRRRSNSVGDRPAPADGSPRLLILHDSGSTIAS